MRRRRTRGDTGAVAVEAALVTGAVFLLIFGIVEFAFLARDYVGVSSAARVGARIASTAADEGPCVADPADVVPCPARSVPELAQKAADDIGQSVVALPEDSVRYIMVYKANEAGFPNSFTDMPEMAQCLSECVVYKWYAAQERFRYFQGFWDSSQINACATSRRNLDGTPGVLDAVGVQVVVEHQLLTGIFGASVELSDHAVTKFEPLANKGCARGEHA
jgi:hypothetical protein